MHWLAGAPPCLLPSVSCGLSSWDPWPHIPISLSLCAGSVPLRLYLWVSGSPPPPQTVSIPHPDCWVTQPRCPHSGETMRVATCSHRSLRTQVWERWAGATWDHGPARLGGGTLPSQRPLPATIFPSFLHFLHLPLPLLFTLPEYAQAVIMGPESSHIYTQPAPVSLPPASHRAGPMEPPAALG